MTGYSIFLSDGTLLTTINVKTVDTQESTSLFLLGQGIPSYGTDVAQDLVWMLENFSKATPPVHPLIGQEWFDLSHQRMNVLTASGWDYYTRSQNVYGAQFDMLGAASNLDMTVVGSTAIFTGANAALMYLPTHVLLLPAGEFTATGAATINLSVTTAGDVVASQALPLIASTQFVNLSAVATPRIIPGTGTLHLNVTTAATGGQLNYNVIVYGAILSASL